MIACYLQRLSVVALGQIFPQATADPPWRGDSEEKYCKTMCFHCVNSRSDFCRLHFGGVGVTIARYLRQLSAVALGRIFPKAGADPPWTRPTYWSRECQFIVKTVV